MTKNNMRILAEGYDDGVLYGVVRSKVFFWSTDAGVEIKRIMDLAEKEKRPLSDYS